MAWTTSGIFVYTIKDTLDGTDPHDLNTDTLKLALFDNTITPDYDAVSASTAYNTGQWLVAAEVDNGGGNWPAGGYTLVSPSITPVSPGAGQVKFDADDVSAASVTLSDFYGGLIYNTSATTVTNQGVCGIYFTGAPYSTTSGTLTITWDTNGIFYLDLVP